MGNSRFLRLIGAHSRICFAKGPGSLRSLPVLAAVAFAVGTAAAQQPVAVPRQQITRNTQTWQRATASAFTAQIRGTVRLPPQELRLARSVVRDGVARLEVPLVAIITPEATLNLDLAVDPDPGLFCKHDGCAGSVQVEVVDADRRSAVIHLPAPMQIDFYGVDTVTPTSITVSSTRSLRRIEVSSVTTKATLKVHPLGLASVDVPLPVRILPLQLRAASRTMDAWGLEKITLSVAPVEGLDPSDVAEIQLQGIGLRVEPSVVQVTSTKGATADIRSRGVGIDSIKAAGPAYIQATGIEIQVKPPWLFFLFALIGGLIGSVAHQMLSSKTGKRWRVAIQIGVVALVALGLATATAIGVNVTGLSIPTGQVSELLGAVEALIIALAIDPIFDRIGGKKKKDDTE